MQKEYDALIKNGTWRLVDPPVGIQHIGCKWIYKTKYKVDGSLDKHKARLVAKGYAQKEGNNDEYISSIKKELKKVFDMTDLGLLHYYLGIEVDKKPQHIFISQKKYVDSDFDRDKENGVSTSGYLMNLGSTSISWRSRKQSVATNSTTKAEYVAAAQATKEIIWIRKILEDLQEKKKASTPLFVDNSSTIQLAKNPKFHDRTKRINTKYHLIRHHVEAKTIHPTHCPTSEQIADIFSKALGREKFETFRSLLGM
eukprot:PITA_08265